MQTFTTDRLILKSITEKDIPSYEKYFIDYDVVRYLSNIVPWPYPEEGVRWFLENDIWPRNGKDKWTWGIFLKVNKEEMIGAIEFYREGHPENRGFWLGKPFWGKGIMTEAVERINQHTFEDLGFEKLIFANGVGNFASRKVKEKTGCKYLYEEDATFVSSEFTKTEYWELTKEEWLKHRK